MLLPGEAGLLDLLLLADPDCLGLVLDGGLELGDPVLPSFIEFRGDGLRLLEVFLQVLVDALEGSLLPPVDLQQLLELDHLGEANGQRRVGPGQHRVGVPKLHDGGVEFLPLVTELHPLLVERLLELDDPLGIALGLLGDHVVLDPIDPRRVLRHPTQASILKLCLLERLLEVLDLGLGEEGGVGGLVVLDPTDPLPCGLLGEASVVDEELGPVGLQVLDVLEEEGEVFDEEFRLGVVVHVTCPFGRQGRRSR